MTLDPTLTNTIDALTVPRCAATGQIIFDEPLLIEFSLDRQLDLRLIKNYRITALPWAESRSIAIVVLLCCCTVASTALGHGDTHEQLEALDALLEQNPDHVASLLERADIQRRHRNFDAALEDLNRARSLSPANNTVYYLTGLTLLEQGEFSEAETSLQIFIGRSPSSPRGHQALAKVLSQQERHLDAAQAYGLAIENQSAPTPDYYLARAHAYMAAGKPYLPQALEGLEEGIALMGPLLTFQRLAIEIEIAQGNYQNAIDRVDRILRDADRKETWLVKKAKVLSSMGREDEANQQFLLAERAIGLLPQRARTSPAIRTLTKTIHQNLNRETHVTDVQHGPDTPL